MAVPFEIPARPAQGAKPWDLEAQFTGVQERAREVETAHGHALDSFAGGTDDEKLTAALSYAAAQTYPPIIRLGSRHHVFSVANRAPYDGMRIFGPPAASAPEKFSTDKSAHRVQLSMNGAWFHNTAGAARVWEVTLADLVFSGSSQGTVITNDASSQYTLLVMHNISATNIRSVCGTLAQPLTMTACFFTGRWHINGCYQTAFHMQGSDNVLFTDGGLIDSSPAHFDAGAGGAGQAHLWFNYMDYTHVGRLFITCEGPWRGVKVSGPTYGTSGTSDNHGAVSFAQGFVVQGRFGSTQRAGGACIRIEGGTAKFRDSHVDFGMRDGLGTNGDEGIIHQTGGYLLLDCPQYIRGNTAEDVPFVYSTGVNSHGRLRDVTRGRMSWIGKPVARVVGGSQLSADDSCITVAV